MGNNTFAKVMIAILLAILAGWLSGTTAGIFGVTFYQIYDLIGHLFMNALTVVVVPLVTASIITGTAKMGGEHSLGSLGVKTFGYYLSTSFLAILVGWAVITWVSPGEHLELSPSVGSAEAVVKLEESVPEHGFGKVENILLQLVPSNIFAAASKGQMISLILFSILFGYFMTRIDPQVASILNGFWQGVLQTMMKITHFIMKALPIGVFGLVAKVAASTGMDTLTSLAIFAFSVLIGLLIYMCIILPLILKYIAKVSPWKHFQAMMPALVTAFSTSSSAATLPIMFECLEKRAFVSNRICSFTLPLGMSFNLAGSAMFICMAVFFIAQVYGVEFSLSSQLLIVVLTLLISLGLTGIPSASLIGVVIILTTMGLPAEGIGLLFAVDRILDMLRTTTNVFSNSSCCVLVAKSDGEVTALA